MSGPNLSHTKSEPVNDKFFAVFSAALEIGLDIIRTLERQNTPIESHEGYKIARFEKNGMPVFYNSGLKNYSQPFGLDYFASTVNCRVNPVFNEFLDFVKQNDIIRKHLEIRDDRKITPPHVDKETIFEKLALELVTNTLDLYLHKNREGNFSKEYLKPYFREIERGIFDTDLDVNILVPIVMLSFDFDSIWLSDDVAIFKMNNEAQEARAYLQDKDPKIHWAVANVTSHAFLFKGFKLKNKGYWDSEKEILNLISENTDLINNHFAMLKVITGYQTGYAQILISPIMWAYHYMAHLPSFIRKSARNYPAYFDDEFRNEIPVVKKETIEKLSKLQSNKEAVNNKRIKLALRRLNACLLRDNEEDKILDAAIGLEALFGDSEKQEMTHKLALRVAAVSKLNTEDKYNVDTIFDAVKKIYSYRSAVAHGNKDAKNQPLIEINSQKILTTDLAIKFLRESIIVLIENPKYLEPKIIDSELLLK